MPDLAVASVACSDVGLKRAHNEDSFLERPDIGLWVVADGMGGATAGDVASRAVVVALDAIAEAGTAPALMTQVRGRIDSVNADLRDMAESRGEDVVIGSTVAGLVIHGRHFACFWAGDSRVYRCRNGELDRLTRDHSLVQEMVDAVCWRRRRRSGTRMPASSPARSVSARTWCWIACTPRSSRATDSCCAATA